MPNNTNMIGFEELQKIWDHQNGKTMYAINEHALHKVVSRKKNAATKRINKVETGITVINSIVAIILVAFALNDTDYWGFVNAGLMAATVVYVQYFRWQRKKSENVFDRSLSGELDHAIANTESLIRFNYFLIIGYLLPFAVIQVSQMIDRTVPTEKWVVGFSALTLAFLLMWYSQRKCHIPRKNQLVALRKKLISE